MSQRIPMVIFFKEIDVIIMIGNHCCIENNNYRKTKPGNKQQDTEKCEL